MVRLYNPTETRSRITGTPALRPLKTIQNVVDWTSSASELLNQMYLLEDQVWANRHNMSGGFLWNEEEEVIKGEGDE